jgi:hypothetical protein
MCFGQPPAPKPSAPAPAPPQALADRTDPTSNRTAEDLKNFGSTTPSLRVDRSATPQGVATGTGITGSM